MPILSKFKGIIIAKGGVIMHEINGICYSDNHNSIISVMDVQPLDDYTIIIYFSTGETKLFDANEMLKTSLYSKLKNKEVWNNPTISCGSIAWDQENLDIAPETLYNESVPYHTK